MKILLVAQGDPRRGAMAQTLAADGHELAYAGSCSDALKKYARGEFDLVVMDITLADCDGFQCTQRLRALAVDRLVQVLLSMSMADHQTLLRFIDCGATDFIDEPDNPLLLRVKVSGFAQTRALYRQMEGMREKFHQEVRFARHMFDAVLRGKPVAIPGLQHWSISAGHFCGDLTIQEMTPEGRLNIMLGDFTGHGLAAAVGAVPASDVFFAMTRKGLPLGQIAAEINRKLHRLLPTGNFCAATLVSLDLERQHLEAWIGGQPPLLLLDGQDAVGWQLPSTHLPLGVVGDGAFDAETQSISVAGFCHLLLYSDGLLEARNGYGEVFGEAGLARGVRTRSRQEGVMLGIKRQLIAFLDGLEPHDDVSVLAFELPVAL